MEDRIVSNRKSFAIVLKRKRELLERKRFTNDAAEIKKIDKQLEEIEVLLKQYKEPTTRRRIVRKED